MQTAPVPVQDDGYEVSDMNAPAPQRKLVSMEDGVEREVEDIGENPLLAQPVEESAPEVEPEPETAPQEDPPEADVEDEEDMYEDEDDWDIDALPPTEPMWPGGPTPLQVKEWKAQFGDEEVYMTPVRANKMYVWRTLSRFEYRNLVRNVEQMVSSGTVTQGEANLNNEEAVTELCLLWPKMNRTQIVKENAGMASLIAQQVMEASSFVALDVRQL